MISLEAEKELMQHSYPETDLGERPDVCLHSALTFYSHMTPFTYLPPARFSARTLTSYCLYQKKKDRFCIWKITVTLNSVVKTNIGCKKIKENNSFDNSIQEVRAGSSQSAVFYAIFFFSNWCSSNRDKCNLERIVKWSPSKNTGDPWHRPWLSQSMEDYVRETWDWGQKVVQSHLFFWKSRSWCGDTHSPSCLRSIVRFLQVHLKKWEYHRKAFIS